VRGLLRTPEIIVGTWRAARQSVDGLNEANVRDRAEAIVAEIVGWAANDARRFVEQADGDVKLAVLLGCGVEPGDAAKTLGRHDGNLRMAINEIFQDKR
jgi:N-acetylmuramic acid 6-phosphate etherase